MFSSLFNFDHWKNSPDFIPLPGLSDFNKPIQIDLAKKPYEPTNLQHQMFISQHITSFNEAQKRLFDCDKILGIGTGLLTSFWLMGVFTIGINLLGYTALYFASKKYGREALALQYQTELKNLWKIYCWCGSAGIKVTHDQIFLELLKVVGPYIIQGENLILWPMEQIKENDISQPYVDFLRETHHIHLIFVKKDDYSSFLFSQRKEPLLKKIEIENANNSHKSSYQQGAEDIFSQSKRIFYGFEPSKQEPKVQMMHRM